MMHGSNNDRPLKARWPEAIYWHHRFQDTQQQDLTDKEILTWREWIETAENRLIYEKYCGLLAADHRAGTPAHPAIPVMVASTALICITFLVSSDRPASDPVSSLLQSAPQGLRTLIASSPPTPSTQPLSRPDHIAHALSTHSLGSAQTPRATLVGVTPSPREISPPAGSPSPLQRISPDHRRRS
jgi:hypothetical protein